MTNYPVNLRHYVKYRLGIHTAFTQTSPAEREVLRKHAIGKGTIAEIGVYEGVNTLMFRQAMADDGTVVAIDPYVRSFFGLLGFGWHRRIAHREVARTQRGSVIWVERLGHEAPTDPRVADILPIDMLFIDGDHSWEGVERDWLAWRTNVEVGGIVALHDSINCPRPNVGSEAFTQQVVKSDPAYEFVEEIDTLTIMRRIA